MGRVHESCLRNVIVSGDCESSSLSCRLCLEPYQITVKEKKVCFDKQERRSVLIRKVVISKSLDLKIKRESEDTKGTNFDTASVY
jgi:hypothetical protein